MPQMRIRHLMLLVLYIAIGLALSMPAINAGGLLRTVFVNLTLIGVPLVWAGLSWLILRPGPHRDWIIYACLVVSLAALFLFQSIAFVNSVSLGVMRGRFGWGWVVPILVTFSFGFQIIWTVKRLLMPKQCPRCGKRSLQNAEPWKVRLRRVETTPVEAEPQARGEAQRLSYYLCESCGLARELSSAEAQQCCPSCGGIAWVRLRRLDGFEPPRESPRGDFYWCLACSARCKQLVPGVWEDAVSPEDDRPYLRRDFIGWIGDRFHRITKNDHFMKPFDDAVEDAGSRAVGR
jgi:predicted RNA-binding Zn-ribbon protein involved in translation (DUF1610 family)